MIAVRRAEEKRGSRALHSPLAAAALAAIALHSPFFTLRLAAQSAAVIETVAGSANTGDGGPATAANLRFPLGVAADGAGNLYIADQENQRIAKVDAATGNISTAAGNGTQGYGGDGGPAAAAQLNRPRGAAVDGAGNLYIADTNNHRVRKVSAAGVISTVAGNGTPGSGGDGGPAAAAQLDSPHSVAADGAGNIYIADRSNHRIRKVDASGSISTIAGTGTRGSGGDGGLAASARLNYPSGVALDTAGNLYIADRSNHRIRKVDASGSISTVAGNGTRGSGGDGGAATAAQLNGPYGAALDGAGNLYIADSSNNRIRKVDTAGVITTVAGTGTQGYSGDGGPAAAAQIYLPSGAALDGAGNLYIADTSNNRIRKVDTAGIISTAAGVGFDDRNGDGGAAAAAQLFSPRGAALDRAGNLYIADRNHQRIRKADTSGSISTVAGNGTQGDGGDGGPAASAQLKYPGGAAADRAGNLYIADTNNKRIRKVDAAGVITTIAGTGTFGYSGDGGLAAAAQLSDPGGVAADRAGNIYIADTFNHRIRKVDTAGVITTVAGTWTRGYNGDDRAATSAQLNYPYGVAADAAGNIYIADTVNRRIRKVDAAGMITTVAGTGTRGYGGDGGRAAAAHLDTPYGVATDRSGNIYIADTNNHRVRKVDAAGVITTVAGTGTRGYSGDGCAAASARLNSPYGVAVGASGDLYVVDSFNHRIRRVGPRRPGSAPCGGGGADTEQAPAVRARTSNLQFSAVQDGGPVSSELEIYVEEGDFSPSQPLEWRISPSARRLSTSPRSGSLPARDGAALTLAVTVDPAGMRTGRHNMRLYLRTDERLTGRVNVALEVLPPLGPAVEETVNAAIMSAYAPGPFGPLLLPLAPGSLVVVQGMNFAEGEPLAAEGFPLPTSLGGVRVLFNGLEAPLFSIGPQRIAAQLPTALGRETPAGGGLALASVIVESGGESSYPRRFWVGPYAPGVFTASGQGSGQAMVVFAGTTSLAAPLGAFEGSLPARAGDMLEIYATGLGETAPPLADGWNSCAPNGFCRADGSNAALRRTTARPRVWVGDYEIAAENILFSGLAPSYTALNMIVMEMPRNVPPSAAAEIVIAIGGRRSQPGATIAVE